MSGPILTVLNVSRETFPISHVKLIEAATQEIILECNCYGYSPPGCLICPGDCPIHRPASG